jgi:hypothetical protein
MPTEKQRAKTLAMRKKLVEQGITKKRVIIRLVCKDCSKIYEIRVNNVRNYTDEIVAGYTCLLCKE